MVGVSLTNGTMIISEISVYVAIVIMLVPGAIFWLGSDFEELLLAS
jgi:hypothetical protein